MLNFFIKLQKLLRGNEGRCPDCGRYVIPLSDEGRIQDFIDDNSELCQGIFYDACNSYYEWFKSKSSTEATAVLKPFGLHVDSWTMKRDNNAV